jgi:hypothetical protein
MNRRIGFTLIFSALALSACGQFKIGDYVWWDINFNGIQDNGEPGVANVTLRLYNSDNELVDTAVTDRDGKYGFNENFPDGEYVIEIQRPVDAGLTKKDERDDDSVDSDFDPVSFRTDPFDFTQKDDTRDAGLLRAGDTQSTPTPIPTNTPTPTSTPPATSNETYDGFLDILDISSDARQVLVDHFIEDLIRDIIFSIEGRDPGMQVPHVDLVGHVAAPVDFGQEAAGSIFGEGGPFVCGNTLPGFLVVCPDSAGPMIPGEYLMVASLFDGHIPLEDSDNFYTYSVVFDSDGDPSNNFTFVPPFNWDLYQNTDWWLELNWVASQGQWFLDVLNAESFQPLPTNSRAVIWDDMIVFFIPVSELGIARPGYRVTSFCHDGTFNAATSGGDVNGADPTVETELTQLQLQSVEPINIEGMGPINVSVP